MLSFVVVVPYVFVGGVVQILSLTGCVLIFFIIKNPSLVIVSPGNMNGAFFCCGGPDFGFCFCFVLKTFGGCCFYSFFGLCCHSCFSQANQRTNSEVKDSPWRDVYL